MRSIVRQSFRDWALIVVDDGSEDGTPEAALAAAGGDPRVVVERIEHGGIVRALQVGCARVRGQFIARMDADDEAHPDRLGEQVALFEARPDVAVASCLVEFGGDASVARGYALHVDWINSLVDPGAIALNRFIDAPVAHPSVMFRRACLEAHGGYHECGWPEDYELWLRWMEAGVRFAKVPRVLLRWNDPPGRLSRVHASYGEAAFYASRCYYLARWLRANVVPSRRPILLRGAGRITRKRFAPLEDAGLRFAGFIDVDPAKTGRFVDGRPVIAPGALPGPDACFVVVGVGKRGARDVIRTELFDRGFVEGRDFIVAA